MVKFLLRLEISTLGKLVRIGSCLVTKSVCLHVLLALVYLATVERSVLDR